MNISIILANPNPQSFNHAIARAAAEQCRQNGHSVNFHDLDAEGFDPILPAGEVPKGARLPTKIERHCQEIGAADGVIIIHPNWWGMPPAILTGWVNRVLRPGLAYQFLEGDRGEGVPVGLLKARAALIFNTSNTSAEREQNIFGDPLERIWKDCIFGLCGVTHVQREMYRVIVTSSAEQRAAWLEQTRATVTAYFPPG